jgi:hypothetical protein
VPEPEDFGKRGCLEWKVSALFDKKTVDSEQQTVRIRQGKTDPVECEIVIEFPEHGGHVPEGGMSELNAHQGPFFIV